MRQDDPSSPSLPGNASFSWLGKYLPEQRPLRILSVGCGLCREGEYLLEKGAELTGIDLDEVSLAKARHRMPQAVFHCRDASQFEVPENQRFDVVLIRRPDIALHPQRWKQILIRSQNWLKGYGRVILTTPEKMEAQMIETWLQDMNHGEVIRMNENLEQEREVLVVNAAEVLNTPKPSPVLPLGVISWDDGEGLMCDLETGQCS